jgi:hypothetical protein
MPSRFARLRQALWAGALFALVAVACATPAAASSPTSPGAIDMASAALGETRHVEVTLPPSCAWAKERRYPVLYLLDGQTHARHAISTSGFLAEQGQVPELILVSVHSTMRVREAHEVRRAAAGAVRAAEPRRLRAQPHRPEGAGREGAGGARAVVRVRLPKRSSKSRSVKR